ncbi:recombinase family protein [Bacillus toyonensis]|uniref:recombinase family protein n=1 Tax=Bacillus cereus group TaxID=86661 RepID=UPI000CD855F4|nr:MULTISPECIES: recombinase family protein [Bacillus cereus group]MEB4816091.1 recombinase family protein [Bacillus thuringiensis]MED3542431.1 recombinase family protein [Bacillus toyonensis]MEE2020790.1 recombinase family protein [Bacillus toyonensis]
MIRGYARVSSNDQNLDTQIEALENFGVDVIYQEKVSGVSEKRPELENLLHNLQEGDTVVVARMDRLARSLKHMLELVEDLERRSVHLVSLDYNFDTRTATGKMLFHIIGAVAEWERELLKEKQKAGLDIAKKKGVQLGRPRKYGRKHEGMDYAIKLYEEGDHTIRKICNITQVSRSALYREINKRNSNTKKQGGK